MKNLIKISIILIVTVLMLGGVVNATTLTLKVTADKKESKIGENIVVTVDWTEGMQAADFILNYDKNKVEYVSSSIKGTYCVNDADNGKVKVVWFSDDDTDMTKINFTFKAKAEGESQFSVVIDGGFADGNVVRPDSYDVTTYGLTAVTLKAENNTATPTPETKPTPTPTQNSNKDEATPAPTQKPTTDEVVPVQTQKPAGSTTITKPTSTAKAPTVIPKAGDGINILVAIPVLLAITVLAYVQIKKHKNI